MAIKRYNGENARMKKGSKLGQPTLLVMRKGGFRINKNLVGRMGLKAGDAVELLHDEDDGEWYLAKSKDGLPLSKGNTGGMCFHSRLALEGMKDQMGCDHGTMRVADEPVEMEGLKCYALLLSSLRQLQPRVRS